MSFERAPKLPLASHPHGIAGAPAGIEDAYGGEKQRANVYIEPIRSDYARLDIDQGFNWPVILKDISEIHGIPLDRSAPLYLVVFRSQLNRDADKRQLRRLDDRAHDEAKALPGYRCYFPGEPDDEGVGLSFCVWADQESAANGAKAHRHSEAAKAAGGMYKSYKVEPHIIFPGNTLDEEPLIFGLKD